MVLQNYFVIRMDYCEESSQEDVKPQIRPPIIVGPSQIKSKKLKSTNISVSIFGFERSTKKLRADRSLKSLPRIQAGETGERERGEKKEVGGGDGVLC